MSRRDASKLYHMALTVAEVETAIAAIQTGGQSFTVNGLTYTAANLSALIALRDQIKSETARTAGTRPIFRRFNLSGMGYAGTTDAI